jgi:hypothetical protein
MMAMLLLLLWCCSSFLHCIWYRQRTRFNSQFGCWESIFFPINWERLAVGGLDHPKYVTMILHPTTKFTWPRYHNHRVQSVELRLAKDEKAIHSCSEKLFQVLTHEASSIYYLEFELEFSFKDVLASTEVVQN